MIKIDANTQPADYFVLICPFREYFCSLKKLVLLWVGKKIYIIKTISAVGIKN